MFAKSPKDSSRDSEVQFLAFLRKQKVQPSYEVPELHNTTPYNEPGSVPPSLDTFHKRKPLLALAALFGVKSNPSSRKGSISSVSSTADSNTTPPSEIIPAVPPLPMPRQPRMISSNSLVPEDPSRSRTSSSSKAPSDMYSSKEIQASSHSHLLSNSTSATSPSSTSQRLSSSVVSPPPKKRSPPARYSLDVPQDRPPSSQSQHRASISTTTTGATLVPSRMAYTSRRNTQASPVRESFASESSTNSNRYRTLGLGLGSPNIKTMSVVDEEGRLVETTLEDTKPRSNQREASRSHSVVGRSSSYDRSDSNHSHRRHHSHSTTRMQSTKHGSFDFERPGWWSTHASAYQARPVTNLLDVRRSTSFRGDNRSSPHPPHILGDGGGSLGRHSGVKFNSDPSSSTQRAQNDPAKKKAKRNSLRLGIETGLAKLKGGFMGHGSFAFESPVASPTRQSTSFPSKDQVSRPQTLRQSERSFSPTQSNPPVAFTNHMRPTRGKGRSLDLGIGLSWAPRTMREDILLPGSSLIPGQTRSPSPLQEEDDEIEQGEQKLIGHEIASIFRNALDEDGYTAFQDFIQRFDSNDIPFDGPKGIISRVERLLNRHAPGLSHDNQTQLLGTFVRVLLQNS